MNMRSSSAATGVKRSVPQVAYYSYWGRTSRSGRGEVGTEDLRDSRETLRVGDKLSFMCMQGIFFVHDSAVSIKHSLSHFYIYIDKVTLSPPRLRV